MYQILNETGTSACLTELFRSCSEVWYETAYCTVTANSTVCFTSASTCIQFFYHLLSCNRHHFFPVCQTCPSVTTATICEVPQVAQQVHYTGDLCRCSGCSTNSMHQSGPDSRHLITPHYVYSLQHKLIARTFDYRPLRLKIRRRHVAYLQTCLQRSLGAWREGAKFMASADWRVHRQRQCDPVKYLLLLGD